MPDPTISIVVPAFNEAEVLPNFHSRLARVMRKLGETWEVVFVNDGSRDGTLIVMQELRRIDPHVAIVNLSRNFGKEIALTAGLDHALGQAIVVIDADLQDPPEVIPDMIAAWRQGFDTVYAQRRRRDGESWLKRATAHAFYRVMRRVGNLDMPPDAGDFRLISRRVVEALGQVRERHRFMKGLFAWVGFPATRVLYDRAPRHAGHTKWNYWKLWNFALEGITSFTVMPLKLATYTGLLIALLAGVYLAQLLFRTLVFGNPVAGYPSLLAVLLFMGGAQFVMLGIIGEYLGRIFNETKRRPLYLVEAYVPAHEKAVGTPAQVQSPIAEPRLAGSSLTEPAPSDEAVFAGS